MRWSIIKLIWLRELRDQLRDRRTLFMIAGLPLLLYPVLGFAVLQLAVGFTERPSVIAVVRTGKSNDFPPTPTPFQAAALALPPPTLPGAGLLPGPLAAAGLVANHAALANPLLLRNGELEKYGDDRDDLNKRIQFKLMGAQEAQAKLQDREVDLVLSADADFWLRLGRDKGRAALHVQTRKGDDGSRIAVNRLYVALERWKKELKAVQLERQGLPRTFDEAFEVRDPSTAEAAATVRATSLFDLMVKIFPFMLVMWSLAGALYPAVDVCAGEKERGTMETLLISPAGREEIVLGKFLTIWVFSAGTALLNLLSMGVTTWQFSSQLPTGALSFGAICWCVLLVLPLSAFFSAVCLSVGAYARSSKEGQYYLMPLFLVTMPLIFLTLAPGVELNSFYSMVPVTGVALLMQRLMTSASLDTVPWFYFVSVLAPIALYSWFTLRWAIDMFNREEVLFREAERIDVRLWLRRLFRDKEATPTAGQALACFGLLVGLRWLSLGLGAELPLLARSGVVLAAFVATPPLFMALLLTRRPREGLSLRMPSPGYVAVALLLLPLAEWVYQEVQRFPNLVGLLRERQLFVESAHELQGTGAAVPWVVYVATLALVSAVSKELAFRGLILNGLMRRFRPWTAVLVSSFLVAVYHMNVFVLLPAFVFGVALGVLAVRSRSIVPGILLHLGCYAIVLTGAMPGAAGDGGAAVQAVRLVVAPACALLALGLLVWLGYRGGVRNPLLALVSLRGAAPQAAEPTRAPP
jgi:sodium transport system permease protein